MMATEPYYDRLRDTREPECYRRSMVDFFFAHGENVSETARAFRTSRPTVLKWVQRLRKQGQRGLRDRSRRPHRALSGSVGGGLAPPPAGQVLGAQIAVAGPIS
jgi:transposase-like protein